MFAAGSDKVRNINLFIEMFVLTMHIIILAPVSRRTAMASIWSQDVRYSPRLWDSLGDKMEGCLHCMGKREGSLYKSVVTVYRFIIDAVCMYSGSFCL